jgi:hypothetical protein
MVTDEELGAGLGAQLHRELADLAAPAGLAGAVHRRQRRRNLVLSGALALPVLAAGLTVTLLAAGTPAAQQRPPQGGTVASPRLLTVDYVVSQTQQALTTVDQYVVHGVTSGGPVGMSPSQSWADGAAPRVVTVQGDPASPRSAQSLAVENGKTRFLTIDYTRRTFQRHDSPETTDQILGVPYANPTELRELLRAGQFTLVGTEEVAGRRAAHLHQAMQKDAWSVVVDLWVDEQSFLPLKVELFKGPPTGKSAPPLVSTLEWLPRTTQNLDRLRLTVPAGFTEVTGGKDMPGTPPSGPGHG